MKRRSHTSEIALDKYSDSGLAGPVPVMSLNSSMMTMVALMYEKDQPLVAYNNHAVVEAASHSMNSSFWQNLYPPLDDVECHYGLYGLIHDNTAVSLGDAAGTDLEPNLEERTPCDIYMRPWSGYLDKSREYSTPYSTKTPESVLRRSSSMVNVRRQTSQARSSHSVLVDSPPSSPI